jgi:hypothetical protein
LVGALAELDDVAAGALDVAERDAPVVVVMV